MAAEAPTTASRAASDAAPQPPQFSAAALKEIEEVRAKYPTARAALLPALWIAQREFGQVDAPAQELVARTLGVPACWAHTVATFYTLYQRTPPPGVKLQLCTNISCMLAGAYDLLHFMEGALGIRAGGRTPDGRIELEEVECLASCGTAPAMQVGDRYEESLTRDRIVALLRDLGVEAPS